MKVTIYQDGYASFDNPSCLIGTGIPHKAGEGLPPQVLFTNPVHDEGGFASSHVRLTLIEKKHSLSNFLVRESF